MTRDHESVTAAALAMPVPDRVDLAIRLLESVEDVPDEDVDKAWREEIRRRAERIDREGAIGAPWSEVKASILARARSRG